MSLMLSDATAPNQLDSSARRILLVHIHRKDSPQGATIRKNCAAPECREVNFPTSVSIYVLIARDATVRSLLCGWLDDLMRAVYT